MNKKSLFCLGLWCLASSLVPAFAQNGVTQCGTDTGQPAFPLGDYQELPDPNQPNASDWARTKGIKAMWGSSDIRYAQHSVPCEALAGGMDLTAWRGEAVSAQAVVWTASDVKSLSFEIVPQNKAMRSLPKDAIEGGFVRYVMTDELNKGGGGCGYRPDHSVFDSTLVADAIDGSTRELPMKAMSVRSIWVKCSIPASASAGTYKASLRVIADGKTVKTLPLTVNVTNRTLAAPSEWGFHLDLWQNPFAVARYYQVPLWSDAHFEAMRPIMTRLANAGQKIITASIMHKPWNGQTEDYFESMVTWTRRLDGSWQFDYDVFDRWVQFMMDCGINKQINCYSMIPWALSFQYFDQATNRMQFVKAAPGDKEFEEVWVAMLKSFASHLKQKGWFDICMISMDERSMDDMKKTIEVIRKAEPGFKISLAGNYHQEIESDLSDYCITIAQKFPADVLARRKQEGKTSTYYTCCTESHPNTFTFSDPAEATWIGFFCAKDDVDGYLRWAYNSWPKEPLLDSRFSAWAAGDTYLAYPGNRSSVRFEKLIEGIQAFEKIKQLRQEFAAKGNTKAAQQLESELQGFSLDVFAAPAPGTRQQVNAAKALLNSF